MPVDADMRNKCQKLVKRMGRRCVVRSSESSSSISVRFSIGGDTLNKTEKNLIHFDCNLRSSAIASAAAAIAAEPLLLNTKTVCSVHIYIFTWMLKWNTQMRWWVKGKANVYLQKHTDRTRRKQRAEGSVLHFTKRPPKIGGGGGCFALTRAYVYFRNPILTRTKFNFPCLINSEKPLRFRALCEWVGWLSFYVLCVCVCTKTRIFCWNVWVDSLRYRKYSHANSSASTIHNVSLLSVSLRFTTSHPLPSHSIQMLMQIFKLPPLHFTQAIIQTHTL